MATLASKAAHSKDKRGHNGSAAYSLQALRSTFKGCGFIFQHNPRSKVDFMRWLALAQTHIEYRTPQGDIMVEAGVRLLANGATAEQLLDRLSAFDAPVSE